MKIKESLQIGEVARQTGTSIHTIRYYEKIGLIHKPGRSTGGFRVYSQETVDKILFIKKAQGFGLTLNEIEKIMCCGDKGLEPCCAMVTKIFENKILQFERKINELQKMKKRLKSLLSSWAQS